MVDADTGEIKTLLRQPFQYCDKFDLAVSAQIVGAAPSQATPTQIVEVHCGHVAPQFYQPAYNLTMDEYDSKPTEPWV